MQEMKEAIREEDFFGEIYKNAKMGADSIINLLPKVKDDGMREIAAHGPFQIDGDREIMQALDALLQSFVEQQRMKLPGGKPYQPCYQVKVA